MVAVIAALMMIVLLAAVAFAVDMSRLRHERHVVQTAVDFGALSAAGLLPATGPIEGQLAEDMAIDVALDNGPGLTAADVNVTFRCVVVNEPPGQPWLSPDLDFACNDASGGGFSQFLSTGGGPGWKIRGNRAFHLCDPDLGDKCNAIVVRASNDVQYFFAPVIGYNTGNTGAVAGAACKGFCGQPSKPLDIVMVLDRTTSMTQADIDALKSAASGIVDPVSGAFDPTLHKVGLILLPYANPGNPGGTPVGSDTEVGCRVARNQFYSSAAGVDHSWRPVNPSGIPPMVPLPPQWEPPEAMFSGGSDWDTSPWGVVGLTSDFAHLSNVINCIERVPTTPNLDGNASDNSAIWVDNPGPPATYQARGGGHTNYSDPLWAARDMLSHSDPNIEDIVIFFGDGQANQPNDGSTSSGALNPCQRAVQAATDTKNTGAFIYTIAYGVGPERCTEDDVSGGYVNALATTMFADIASDPTVDDFPGTCNAAVENNDDDYYFCTAAASDLDDVFVQIATQAVQRARLIEFD